MKGIPVVKSKLIMPQLSNSFIILERIKNLSKTIHNQRVVTITAPAGYGKTTLMVAALNMYGRNCRICWYRLEQEDRDLAVFYSHFIEALFPTEDKKWHESRENLANYGDIHSQYQFINAIMCQELWAFYNHHDSIKTFIVLDDFQHVADSPEISGSIQYLINNLPENCSIIVSSRSETDILSGKLRLEKNVLEIGSKDLCFSEEELTKLLTKSYGIKTDRKLIQKIMINTEGWAAGIIIMCQVLVKFSLEETDSIFEKSGKKSLLFKYIALEVVKTIDPGLLLFLVKAAILREFTAAEASKILDTENVPHLMAQCEKKGLFIQKIIGEVTTYRFHGLFREILLQVQPKFLTEEEIKDYNLKAATYYIESKIFNRAVEHFILCGNVTHAVELITRESVNLITFEAFDQLRLLFKLLPEDIVNNNGFLLYIKTLTHSHNGDEEAIILIKKALSIFKENNDVVMQTKTLISIVYFYVCRNDARNIIKTLSQAPLTSKSVEDLSLEGMLTVTDLIRAFWEERFSRGVVLNSRLTSFELDEDWKWMALAYSCKLHYLLGELNIAECIIKKALEMDFVRRAETLTGFALLFYSYVLHLKNDRTAFPLVKDKLIAIGEKYSIAYLLGFGKRLSAHERYCEHDSETALEMLEFSTNHFEQLGNRAMYSLNKLTQCLWLSRQRNSRELFEVAKEAFKVLSSPRPGLCLVEIGQSILGALAREAGDYEFAEQSLLSSIKKSKSKKAKQILCGSYLHLAKLYYETGDIVRGEDTLRQAFHIASSNGYVMFWDLHLPTMVEMSSRCVKNNIYSEYALELIARYYGKESAEFFKNNVAITEEPYLIDFCNVFISLYGIKNEVFSSKINVRLLGKFSIVVRGTVISENNWKTRKIEGILKYLILHRGRTITRESLMELFWPGSDKKSASISLRAALYELRKVLKHHGIPPEGKDSLIHEKSGGLIVPAGSMLLVDTDEFLSLYNELKGLSSDESGNVQRIGVLERMVSIYRGNLLEDEIYEDWAFFEREELRSIFLESTLSLASVYVERKEHEKAEKILLKTLALDQYNEEACLCLLKVYISTNQRSRAVKLYLNFENRLRKELNIKPDERLSSVVRDIVL